MHREDKKATALLNASSAENKQLFELDVSEIRDWAYAMANLIEAEVHLHKTFVDTKDERYLDIIEGLRQMRKEVFEDFIRNRSEGIWCWSKHMLSLMMELSEVASKELDSGNKEMAKKYFELSQQALELFVAVATKDLNTEKQ